MNRNNSDSIPRFSVFEKGEMKGSKVFPQNRPAGTFSLKDAHRYITSESAQLPTQTFRSREFSKGEAGRFKLLNFRTATFSAAFSKWRCETDKYVLTPYLVIDFDALRDDSEVMDLRRSLLADPCFDTQLLFTSPSGRGVKWVIEVDDWHGMARADYFNALANYLHATHRHRPDPSGKDVTRLCFLCWDPQCYINPKYL